MVNTTEQAKGSSICPCCCVAPAEVGPGRYAYEERRLLTNDNEITKTQFAMEVAMLMDANKEPKKKTELFDKMTVEKKWMMTREIFVYYTQDEDDDKMGSS